MTQDPRNISIEQYSYELPDERIAHFPLAERDQSKLLTYKGGQIGEDHFNALPRHIAPGSLMVFNNTRVIQARLHFHKDTGALIEVFCLEPDSPADYALNFQQTERVAWLCLIGNLKKWKGGVLTRQTTVRGQVVTLQAERGEAVGTGHRVVFSWDNGQVSFADILESFGELPIPPYLNRATQESDKVTYQTVYSKVKGSVAAPTAGLHFTPRVMDDLRRRGVDMDEITLHVGAGTFKPVKSEEMGGHTMHTEWFAVRRDTIERLLAHGAKAIAVGTTSVRTLESLYHMGVTLTLRPDTATEELGVKQWQPYSLPPEADISAEQALTALLRHMEAHGMDTLHGSTQIIIAPGYRYRVVEGMVTNFHQPRSTLLLLVGAFVGDNWRSIYDYALQHDFRFLSYGDSSLLMP